MTHFIFCFEFAKAWDLSKAQNKKQKEITEMLCVLRKINSAMDWKMLVTQNWSIYLSQNDVQIKDEGDSTFVFVL